jgi:capsular polysaccharide transport system permease protein
MKQRALASQTALTAFRERERLVDPSHVTLAALETIARLSLDASQASVQINELERTSPQAPQIAATRVRRAAIEEQIAKVRGQLAGDAQSIAPRIAEYERLMLERDFAGRALIAAMAELERARVEAQRRQIYLERVAQPSLPDYPAYPWRVVWFLTTFVVGYMALRMWRTLTADALRHNEL